MQFQPPTYKIRCDRCGVEVLLASLPRGWLIVTKELSDGRLDLVNAQHICPKCRKMEERK